MEAHLNRIVTFKEPSLKRDDLLSVLDALANRKIFPKEIYEKAIENLKNILDSNNIILVSSKYVAIQLILQNIEKRYSNLYSSNDINYFYFNQFSGFFNNITPLDINQYSINFDPQQLDELNKSILFFCYNLGYPVDLQFISEIDIISIADLSGSLFSKFNGKHLMNYVDFAICSLKDEEIITSGDGALIYIKDRKIYEKINEFCLNNNLYLSDFNCSLLLSQLSKKDKIIESRKKIFLKIFEETKKYLNDSNWFDSRKILEKCALEELAENSSFTTFTVDANDINIANTIAQQIGIEIEPAIKIPLSLKLKLTKSYPITEKVTKHAIFIPFYPMLTENEINKISYFINKLSSY